MKTFSAALQTHLNGPLTKLATCIKITRTDTTVYGFTTHDRTLVISGVTYVPTNGFTPTDLTGNANLDSDDMTVEGILASATITEDDLRAGRWDYAEFRIFQVNWSDLTMGDKKDRIGHLGEVSAQRQIFVAELLGLMEAYATSVGELAQPGCRYSLGDARCKVDTAPFVVVGTIDACDTDFFTLHDAARAEADGYFDEGIIQFTSGAANGLRYEIKAYLVGLWVTKTAVAYDVTGASYTMTAGCDRRRETCRDRFSNVVNFGGEPFVPGIDSAFAVARHE